VAHGQEPRARVAIRKVSFLLELGSPSHECPLSLRYFDFHVVDAGSGHTYTNAGFTAVRLLFAVQHSMRRCASQSLGQFVAKVVVTGLACTL
jgi:hypothetical protein